MIQISVSSLINEPIRELRFPGFKNVFQIVKLRLDFIQYVRYALIDRNTMMVLVTSLNLADLIYKVSSFLADMSQADLDEYIRIQQEFNE